MMLIRQFTTAVIKANSDAQKVLLPVPSMIYPIHKNINITNIMMKTQFNILEYQVMLSMFLDAR